MMIKSMLYVYNAIQPAWNVMEVRSFSACHVQLQVLDN